MEIEIVLRLISCIAVLILSINFIMDETLQGITLPSEYKKVLSAIEWHKSLEDRVKRNIVSNIPQEFELIYKLKQDPYKECLFFLLERKLYSLCMSDYQEYIASHKDTWHIAFSYKDAFTVANQLNRLSLFLQFDQSFWPEIWPQFKDKTIFEKAVKATNYTLAGIEYRVLTKDDIKVFRGLKEFYSDIQDVKGFIKSGTKLYFPPLNPPPSFQFDYKPILDLHSPYDLR